MRGTYSAISSCFRAISRASPRALLFKTIEVSLTSVCKGVFQQIPKATTDTVNWFYSVSAPNVLRKERKSKVFRAFFLFHNCYSAVRGCNVMRVLLVNGAFNAMYFFLAPSSVGLVARSLKKKLHAEEGV